MGPAWLSQNVECITEMVMADYERKLAKAGWPSRELRAASRGWKKGARIKAQLRTEKRVAKRKIKKLLEDPDEAASHRNTRSR